MAAKIARVDDCISAYGEGSDPFPDGSIHSSRADEKPQVGGIQFDCGYLSPFFITDPERMEVAFENAYILIHQGKISSRKDLLPIVEQVAKTGKPLLIIAEDVEGAALANLVVNKVRGVLQVAAVRAPGFGDQRKRWFQDIARLTCGKAIMEGFDIQLKNIHISDLGQATGVSVDKNRTVIESGTIYHQVHRAEPQKSFPVADCSQNGMREYFPHQQAAV
ncbi:MAG: hypothetical protein WA609_03925 [Terriglobales bacterium]